MLDILSDARVLHSPSLADLEEGESAVLGDFDLDLQVSDHLMNLGFVPGIEVTVAQSGPGGDPRVYRVDGTAVALRRSLAARVAVQPLPAKKTATAADCDPLLALGSEVSAD
jgi:ferrous iron transport protein A